MALLNIRQGGLDLRCPAIVELQLIAELRHLERLFIRFELARRSSNSRFLVMTLAS